ncbi:MAG TPA: glycosyltransferase, partial [Hyphomicrobiaceae bacterium]|nr:glycosyltransferase [Hyphomicrobiaceae bacterium]
TFDVFLFCHKTPESPRCLIEALQCGLPIIGYDSPYPRDLIRRNNGGILTPANDPARLAEALNRVGADKEALFDLNKRAAQDGSGFTDTFVFEHRSLLMKRWTTHRRPVA